MAMLTRDTFESDFVYPLGFWLRHVRTRDRDNVSEMQKATLTFYENLLQMMTCLAAADYGYRGFCDDKTSTLIRTRLFEKLPSDGDYAAVLRQVVSLYRERDLSFLFGLSPDALTSSRRVDPYESFYELMQRGFHYSGKHPVNVLTLLDLVVFYRNRIAHDDAPVDSYVMRRASDALVEAIEPTLEAIRTSMKGLALFWIQRTRVVDENVYRHNCGMAIGRTGIEEAELDSDRFMSRDRVHLARIADETVGGNPEVLFDLSPFFVVQGCDTCMREHIPFRFAGMVQGRSDRVAYLGLPSCQHRVDNSNASAAVQRFLRRLDYCTAETENPDDEADRRKLTLAYRAKRDHASEIETLIVRIVAGVDPHAASEPGMLVAGAALLLNGPVGLSVPWIRLEPSWIQERLSDEPGDEWGQVRLLRGLLILGALMSRENPSWIANVRTKLEDRIVSLLLSLPLLRDPQPCFNDPVRLRAFIQVSGTIGDFILGESFESGLRANTRLIRLWDGFEEHQAAKEIVKATVLKRFLVKHGGPTIIPIRQRLVDLMALIWFGADLDALENKTAMTQEFNLLMRQDPNLEHVQSPTNSPAHQSLPETIDHLALVIEVISNHFFYVRKEFGTGAIDAMQRVIPSLVLPQAGLWTPETCQPLSDLLLGLSFYYLFTQRYS
jgi:hypothetical protein